MKKYNVNVNGTDYEVAVELIEESDAKMTPTKKEQAPVTEAKKVKASPSGGERINSPMPGTILDVQVSEGQAVKKGTVLMILEAMKMENEIMAPCDGTVRDLSVAKGATVESGTLLCTLA